MHIPAPEDGKAKWRRWAQAARGSVDFPEVSRSVVDGLLAWGAISSARRVLVFLPLADEIDLRPLFDADLDASFAATHTPPRGGRLTIHELGGPLEVHRFGFLQPHESAPRVDPADLDVLLLPGLAFDLWGTRLGRGAGYFDRLLMHVTGEASIVGVTPSDLVVDRLPREPHDVPVGYLASEEGVVGVAR